MENFLRILTVDDDPKFLSAVQDSLKSHYEIRTALNPQEAMGVISQSQPDLVLLDYSLPDMTGLEMLKLLRRRFPSTPVIMLTGESDPDTIIETMKSGASDYVIKGTKDFESNLHFRIKQVVDKINLTRTNEELHQTNISQSEQNRKLALKLIEQAKAYEILGISKSTIRLRSDILKFKGTNAFTLITGENGTGKELVARNLNLQEDDPSRPFVALNCTAISPLLFESEFFGHVRGAFTGATENKVGQFKLADGGDIFLDEVAEIPTEMQVKLLRVIQEGVFTPVGATKSVTASFRVIAATNRDLITEINKGRFREDLYYRLNQIQFVVTPLRERREDILFVAEELLKRSFSMGIFSDDAKKCSLITLGAEIFVNLKVQLNALSFWSRDQDAQRLNQNISC